jgi:predicted N-acetyltransferase YhbS
MKILIRKTDEKDYFQTESLTREAFWNLYQSGCDEHLVLNQLRVSQSYIPQLDLIALSEGEIVGHIISSSAKVMDEQEIEHQVLCLGPVSVFPELQNKGIGSELIRYSIGVAQNMGFNGIILFGNPDYYHRFGFRNAKEYGITTKDLQNFEPFTALELQKDGLNNVQGRFFEDEAFSVKEEHLTEFEKKFPFKEKGKPRIDISQI